MDFLGTPDIGPWLFFGLTLASFVTAFIGVFTGTAGGVILLALMAMVMPPTILVPVHTVVQLGSGVTRTLIMWRYVMKQIVPPFILGFQRMPHKKYRFRLKMILTLLAIELLARAASQAGFW